MEWGTSVDSQKKIWIKMDLALLLLIGIVGGTTTYGMIELLRYLHTKENK